MTEAKQNEKTGSILPPRLVSTSFLVAISIAILALFLAFAACAGVLYVHLHHASRQENLNTELSKLRNRFEQLQKKVSIDSVKKRVEDLGPKAEKVISSSGAGGQHPEAAEARSDRRARSVPNSSNSHVTQVIDNAVERKVRVFMQSMFKIFCVKDAKLCLPGPKGEKGPTGVQGLRGPQGPSGTKGTKGSLGPKGDQGTKGTRGDPGKTGPRGPPGFNGKKGQKGDKGLAVSAPIFIIRPKSMAIREKYTASFKCKVEGLPKPDVTWRRVSGGILPPGRHVIKADGSLTLSSVKFQDRGSYECLANNILGSAKARVTLSVEVPTKITARPVHQIVEEGKKIELVCKAWGSPPPIVTWTRRHGPLPPRRHTVTNGRLVITKAKLSDGAFYTCTARNKLRLVRASAQVMIVPRLRFTVTPPRKVKTLIGKTVSLDCRAESGTFKPTITWSKKKGTLPPGSRVLSNGTLVMKPVALNYRGMYRCTAKNFIKSVVTSVTLEILTTKTCSELRRAGITISKKYTIDPDGTGGVAAFYAFCDMTDKGGVGVTIISHDSETRTLVNGFNAPGSYSRDVKYNGVSKAQLVSLIGASLKCEQFIKYECYDSVLLYHGNNYGWWVSRDGQKMMYWGGATPGSGKCACGMTNSCATKSYRCNCDNNDNTWREDSGLLRDKSTLPVSQLRFGDTGGGEQGYHILGKFKCYGRA